MRITTYSERTVKPKNRDKPNEELHKELDRILSQLFLEKPSPKKVVIVAFRLRVLSIETTKLGEMKKE